MCALKQNASKLLRCLNHTEERHKMFTCFLLICLGKDIYLNILIDQLQKLPIFSVSLKFLKEKDSEIHYILRRYNMVCYPFHVLTQFLNFSYVKNLKVDEMTHVNIYHDLCVLKVIWLNLNPEILSPSWRTQITSFPETNWKDKCDFKG